MGKIFSHLSLPSLIYPRNHSFAALNALSKFILIGHLTVFDLLLLILFVCCSSYYLVLGFGFSSFFVRANGFTDL